MSLASLLSAEQITSEMQATERWPAIVELIDLLVRLGRIKEEDRESILAAPQRCTLIPREHLDDSDASAAVATGEDHGVSATLQTHGDSRLTLVFRCETAAADLCSLLGIILPVVVREEQGAIAIT